MDINRAALLFFYRYAPLTIDKEGRIIYLTHEYSRVLGSTQEALLGRRVDEVIPTSRLPGVLKNRTELFGESFETANGERYACDYLLLRDEAGEVEGAICITPYFRGYDNPQNIDLIENLHRKVNKLLLEKETYYRELTERNQSAATLNKIVGHSSAIKNIKETILKIADTNVLVLITGETGVGKEIIGNAIHQHSNRNAFQYVKVNCAAIPQSLIESELFGYEGGSFSGAARHGKMGKFEYAQGGTILLDEIGELPMEAQGKLLRVLQEKEIVRVGSNTPVKLNVRVICSTNCNLYDMVQKGTFRRDLYYRINIVELHIPPLRDRREDIPALCNALITRINHYHNTFITGVTDAALALFEQYDWPGNVRELEHLLEKASIMQYDGLLDAPCFNVLERPTAREDSPPGLLSSKKDDAEREVILRALEAAGGNKSGAAKQLGISRQTLYEKIRRHQLDRGK